MSAPQFTPGPWHISMSARQASDSEMTRFCVSHGTNSYGDGPEGDVAMLDRTTEANAHLIATAPELYQEVEFLCARLRELETMILDDEVGNEYYGHVAPSRARLEMLLEKARGDR